MPSTYTLNNGIELIATGEQSGTWGDTTNVNLGLIDTALDGQVTITLPAAGSSGSPNALAISDGAASNGRNRLIIFTDGGDLGATAFVQLTPNDAEKIVYIRNNLSGGRAITLFQGTYNASNDYEVPAGTTAVVFFDGGGSGAVAANVFNNAFFDSLRLGGVSVTAILDEDNMASDSATALATQQSIKAYVDAQVGANNELSEVLANGNTSGGNNIQMTTTDEVQFRDTALTISSSVDGQLDIAADVELEIVAPTLDINASTAVTIDTTTLTMTGSVNVVGDLDVDNININGNTIISTDTNGNIALTPNGTGEVDITKVDIDGGTIDGTTIGGASAAAGTFTTATATTGNITTVNATTVDTTNIEVTNIKAKDGTASATIADSTGVMTVASSVLTTTDINGGTIDGTTIGGTTPAAITGTTITGTGFVTSGDMTFGDNDKAIFGAGSDLQIFHNGSHSYINEGGTGNLRILAENFNVRNPADNENMIIATPDSGVILYYDGAQKLATTATGIDVTGTVTADGLTVNKGSDGSDIVSLTGASAGRFLNIQSFTNSGAAGAGYDFNATSGQGAIQFSTVNTARLKVDYNGDISFYEDTGTTPKFFWDASAEALGLGVTSPSSTYSLDTDKGIRVSAGAPTVELVETDSSNQRWSIIGVGGLFGIRDITASTYPVRIENTAPTDSMRIDSSGNVGIGTSSPATALDVTGTITSDGLTVEQNAPVTVTLSNTAAISSAGDPYASIDVLGDNSTGAGFADYGARFQVTHDPDLATTIRGAAIRLWTGYSSLAAAERVRISAQGDVSFYEDTGTTPKFFWDASTERLGIGNAAPATALDVTGTITSDGLDVGNDGQIYFASTAARIEGTSSGADNINIYANSNLVAKFVAGGDISFYEDTGTTPKFFWDASAEALGIGTSSPKVQLDILGVASTYDFNAGTDPLANLAIINNNVNSGTGPAIVLGSVYTGSATVANARIFAERQSTGATNAGATDLIFEVGQASGSALVERLRIDSSGNVGIGTSSPTNLLDVNSDSIRVRTAQTPATAGAAGNQGEIAWDADYVYVCTATNTWKRVAIATW